MSNPLESVPPGLDVNGQPEVHVPHVLEMPLPTTIIPNSFVAVAPQADGSKTLIIVAVLASIELAPGSPLPLARYEIRLNAAACRTVAGGLSGGVVLP